MGWRASFVQPGLPGFPGPCGGWPCRLLRGGTVPCRAAPGPVTETAPPGHQRCRVVPGRLGVVLPQRAEPVLSPPPGGVRGIHDDHVQARIRCHLAQPAAELAGGDAGHHPPERAAASAERGAGAGPFASFGAGGGEVQVLDHDRPGTVLPGGGDQRADGGPQPPVPGVAGRSPAPSWVQPSFSFAIGLVILAVAWLGEQPGEGVVALVGLTVFGLIFLLAGAARPSAGCAVTAATSDSRGSTCRRPRSPGSALIVALIAPG